jgi:hypothetical protein
VLWETCQPTLRDVFGGSLHVLYQKPDQNGDVVQQVPLTLLSYIILYNIAPSCFLDRAFAPDFTYLRLQRVLPIANEQPCALHEVGSVET